MKEKEDRKTVITSCNLWIKGIFHTNFQINVLLNSYLIFLDYKHRGETIKNRHYETYVRNNSIWRILISDCQVDV